MASSTPFPIDQEAAPALSSPTSEKCAVSANPSIKEPDDNIQADSLEVMATSVDEIMANPPTATKAMRRKGMVQFVVLCMGNFVCGWTAGVVGPLGPRLLEAYHVRDMARYCLHAHDRSFVGGVLPLVDQLLYDSGCMSHRTFCNEGNDLLTVHALAGSRIRGRYICTPRRSDRFWGGTTIYIPRLFSSDA